MLEKKAFDIHCIFINEMMQVVGPNVLNDTTIQYMSYRHSLILPSPTIMRSVSLTLYIYTHLGKVLLCYILYLLC